MTTLRFDLNNSPVVTPSTPSVPSVTTVEEQITDYSCSFAVAFCEGVADDVLRMWANNELIFDKTGDSDIMIKDGVSFKFYSGSETQDPDDTIASYMTDALTPAFRGLCYVVFDDFPLADFGNSIPSIVAEITTNASNTENITLDSPFSPESGGLTSSLSHAKPDFPRHWYYCADEGYVLRRFNQATMNETRQKTFQGTLDALGNDVANLRVICVTDEGYIVVRSDSGNNIPVSVIDPESFDITGTFGTVDLSVPKSSLTKVAFLEGESCSAKLKNGGDTKHYAVISTYQKGITILDVTGGQAVQVWNSTTFSDYASTFASNDRVKGVCQGTVAEAHTEVWCIMGARYNVSSTANINLYLITLTGEPGYSSVYNHETSSSEDIPTGVDVSVIASLSPGDIIDGATELWGLFGPIYDQTDQNVMFTVTDSTLTHDYLVKYDVFNQAVLWVTQLPSTVNYHEGMNQSYVKDGVIGWLNVDNALVINTLTGDIILNASWNYNTQGSGYAWWNGKSNSYIASDADDSMAKFRLLRGDGGSALVSDIITDLCDRVNLSASDIDVSDLTSLSIPGYAIKSNMSVRNAIEPLQSMYFIDAVESDHVIKFVQRDGSSSVATIAQDDLISMSNGDYVSETRTQEVDIPSQYSISYLNKNKDYESGTQTAKRILTPSPAMNSRSEKTISFDASLGANTAKQIAEKALYSEWIGRSRYTFDLDWTWITLDPSDIVTINLDDGTTFLSRLAETEIGADFTMEMKSVSETSAQYTSTATSYSGTSGLTQVFTSFVETKTILLNAPILNDGFDNGRSTSAQFFVMGAYTDGYWPGGKLYKSSDNESFEIAGASINGVTWGYAGNALGDTSTPFSTDETNTLTVYMNAGSANITSATQTEMVNGANVAALINSDGNPEIIQFRDVTENPDGSFTLSGLLRGRRGTEVFTSGHAAGDKFVLLSMSTLGIISLPLSDKDGTIYYRGVPKNYSVSDVYSVSNNTPMNDLKPYAPNVYSATKDGSNNVTISWFRRTRIDGSWKDGTGIVPLNEDTEEYEIDIYSGPTTESPSGTIVRTVTGLSSPSYTYSAANQASDGLSVPLSDITVKVYQISAQVGRGHSKESTLEVI